jgi:hypothetical protein
MFVDRVPPQILKVHFLALKVCVKITVETGIAQSAPPFTQAVPAKGNWNPAIAARGRVRDAHPETRLLF